MNAPFSTKISDLKKLLPIEIPTNDFLILDNLSSLPFFNSPQKINGVIFSICIRGEIELYINLKKVTIRKNHFFISLPDQTIQFTKTSSDFSAKTIILASSFIDEIRINPPYQPLPTLLYMIETPYFHLSIEELDILLEYHTFLLKKIKMPENIFRAEIIRHILQALFYEGNKIIQERLKIENAVKTRKEQLFENFLKLVSIYCREKREIGFYANRLHLTSKYLSTSIKEVSGKSAGKWIDEYVIIEAKSLLRNNQLTIQQVANELNFANQSFFGKYFKQHTDLSPSKYRKGYSC